MAKNKHNQNVGSTVERSDDRIKETGEVFTPLELCRQMVSEIPLDILRNPDSRFLDNSAGCGNFLIALRDELVKYHDHDHVVNEMIYCVELMEDNHREICETMGVSVDHPHYVRGDALSKTSYEFGSVGPLESVSGMVNKPKQYTPPKRNREQSQARLF